ncbi:Thymidylate kinase [Methylophaga frappieri]|uniref:Thymidylate kinase n=1 Tax=Methylophaga frappieri (strain ATCC BAA-2434 / DSM 25690 / JAM7) TaxID=754477 RepID=I1YLL4_METFJ|nr:dTMP kinase [Methylophaga frappieri]AFJ03807.1 Thymidylate kinase [Methylophaga frappieri]
MTGKFISLEGIEGAGKSTQMAFIADYLRQHQLTVVETREPGGTPLSEEIRAVLLSPREETMADDTELLLMFAARVQHVQQKILPALAAGKWVLSDRFLDATFAYQGGGRGVSAERIQALSEWSLQGVKTDLTLLFDLSVATGQQRVQSRGNARDRFEQQRNAFFEQVRHCYLQRAANEPERIQVIDASQSVPLIQQQLKTCLDKLIRL